MKTLFTLTILVLSYFQIQAQDVTVTWADGRGGTRVTWETYTDCNAAKAALLPADPNDDWIYSSCEECTPAQGVNITWKKNFKGHAERKKKVKVSKDIQVIETGRPKPGKKDHKQQKAMLRKF